MTFLMLFCWPFLALLRPGRAVNGFGSLIKTVTPLLVSNLKYLYMSSLYSKSSLYWPLYEFVVIVHTKITAFIIQRSTYCAR